MTLDKLIDLAHFAAYTVEKIDQIIKIPYDALSDLVEKFSIDRYTLSQALGVGSGVAYANYAIYSFVQNQEIVALAALFPAALQIGASYILGKSVRDDMSNPTDSISLQLYFLSRMIKPARLTAIAAAAIIGIVPGESFNIIEKTTLITGLILHASSYYFLDGDTGP